VYFINHLESGGMLDKTFNPYEGHRIERTWEGTSEPEDVLVTSNPGFAPKWENRGGWEGNIFGGYAEPTALFNNLQPTPPFSLGSRHIGVDFRGKSEAPIYSFIYGKVINVGRIRDGNGRCVIIANERDRGIYILAHLHGSTERHIRRGMRIEPDDVVAYVGRSGFNTTTNTWSETMWNEHLHLEYYHVQYRQEHDVEEGRRNQYVQVLDADTPNRRLLLQTALTRDGITNGRRNRRDPFDHEKTQL
jgi:murein DD-endopeptidase MepM/ murein hydrolase activator NlpD